MSLISTGQFAMPQGLLVHEHDHGHAPMHGSDELIAVVDDQSQPQQEPLIEVTFNLNAVPGADLSVDELNEPEIVVDEEATKEDEKKRKKEQDENEAKDKKEKQDLGDKWNWKHLGLANFFKWVSEKLNAVPKHSGYDSSGLERAIAYLEKLDNEISKAMKSDIDGELDANQIEKVRSQIEKGVESLESRLDRVKSKKIKKKSELVVHEFQKTAGTPFSKGVYVTVPLLISRIARVCINGHISAGHDLQHSFDHSVKEFDLTKREQAELMQLISDMGYPLRFDRGYDHNHVVDTRSSDNFDWAANYQS